MSASFEVAVRPPAASRQKYIPLGAPRALHVAV
jgi:hypothetical protein